MPILPCGLKGPHVSCLKCCERGNVGNYKKIEICYNLLKRSKEVRDKVATKNKQGKNNTTM